jgi:hypothetical protein
MALARLQVVLGFLFRRHLQALALIEQAGEIAVVADQALALDFGRVRGEHRGDERVGEEVGDGLGPDLVLGQAVEGMDETAFARRRAGQIVGAAAADVVLVLGDVGQLQEVAEGADNACVVSRDSGSSRAASSARAPGSPSRAKRYGGLADALDDREDFLPFLLADGIAEDPAEKPDVGAQRFFLVAVRGVLRHQCWRTRRTEASDRRATCSATEPRRSSARPRWP